MGFLQRRREGMVERLSGAVSLRVGRFLRFVVARPVGTLVLVALLTAGSVGLGMQLQIRATMEELFPESTPHIRRVKELQSWLGYTSQIKLIFSSPDAAANQRFVDDLCERLRGHSDIQRLECRRDITFFRRNALLYLGVADLEELLVRVRARVRRGVARELSLDDEEGPSLAEEGAAVDLDEDFGDDSLDEAFGESDREGLEAGSEELLADGDFLSEEELRERFGQVRLSEYLTNADGTLVGINLFPSISPDDVGRSSLLFADIRGVINELGMSSYHPEMRYGVDGGYHRRINEMEAVQRDLARASVLGGVLVLLLLILYFGKFRAVLFVVVPLMTGIGWTMGAAYLMVGYLNAITAFIITILFGLGVDFSIHAVSRYFEERSAGRSPEDAIVSAMTHLGRPMWWAAATTSATFLSLSFLDFRGFSQFGLIAGVGVVLCFVALYVVLPPLVVVVNRFKHEGVGRFGRMMGGAPWFAATARRAGWTLVVTLVVVAGLGPGVMGTYLDSDLSRVETPMNGWNKQLCQRYRAEVESLSSVPIVLQTESYDEAAEVYRELKSHLSSYRRLQEVQALPGFVPDLQAEKLALVREIRRTIEKKRGALSGEDARAAERAMEFLSPAAFGPGDLPQWVLEKFTDASGQIGRVVFLFADVVLTNSLDIGDVLSETDVMAIAGKSYPTTASYYIGFDVYDVVSREGPWALAIAGCAVFFVLLIDLRNFRRALMTFLPLPLGMVAFLGLCTYAGWPLNVFNMVVLPIFFGIGIDTSIHLVHRGREELRAATAEGRAPDLGRAIGSAGAAAGMSSLTTAAGFSAMLIASNPGLASIGRMAPVGIFLCYLVAVGVTGSLLWLEVRKRPS